MTTPTRKKKLIVGSPARRSSEAVQVAEFEIGKLVQIVSVQTPDPLYKVQWRQVGNKVQLRTPYQGELNIEFYKLEAVEVAAYFPLKPTQGVLAKDKN